MIKRVVVSFLLMAGFCLLSIAYFDRPMALYLQAHRDPVLPVFVELSRLGWGTTWFALSGVVLLLGLFLNYRDSVQFAAQIHRMTGHPAASVSESAGSKQQGRRLIHAGGFALAALCVTGLITRLAKWGIGRWRPKFFLENGLYDFVPFSVHGAYKAASLPSGHSQTIATVCVVIALFRPKWTPYLICIALLVATSRLVLLQHYLADVISGLWLGTVVPLLMWHYWNRQARHQKL